MEERRFDAVYEMEMMVVLLVKETSVTVFSALGHIEPGTAKRDKSVADGKVSTGRVIAYQFTIQTVSAGTWTQKASPGFIM